MRDFINRSQELATLEKAYQQPQSAFVVIYGRRRIGKTTLIKEFIRHKSALYFLADLQHASIQINRFHRLLADYLHDDLLRQMNFSHWDAVFDYYLNRIDFSQGKQILVIDEFQYLAKVEPAFPSILQRIWDEQLANKPIMLILCGSLISLMHKTALDYSSPLYGRRTLDMKLSTLNFEHFKEFVPQLPINKAIEWYSVFGGVPKYIESCNFNRTLKYNIIHNILDKNSFLHAEPRFLLREEVYEPANYFSILKVIAQGEHKLGAIAAKLGLPQQSLTPYLDKLRELQLLERAIPITESRPEKSKKGLYFIKDHFFQFWFKYVFPYQSYLEIENLHPAVAYWEQSFTEYTGKIFEHIARTAILQRDFPFTIHKIGKWWDNHDEIDLVVIGDDGFLLGECKWTQRKVSLKMLQQLEAKKQKLPPELLKKKCLYVFFSKSGFTHDLISYAKAHPDIYLIKSEEL